MTIPIFESVPGWQSKGCCSHQGGLAVADQLIL